jgi:hypothetical protein
MLISCAIFLKYKMIPRKVAELYEELDLFQFTSLKSNKTNIILAGIV